MLKLVAKISKFITALLIIFKVLTKFDGPTKLFSDLSSVKF